MIELALTEEQALLLRDVLRRELTAWRTGASYWATDLRSRGVDLDATIERLESLVTAITDRASTASMT